jgi:hypothetical protein
MHSLSQKYLVFFLKTSNYHHILGAMHVLVPFVTLRFNQDRLKKLAMQLPFGTCMLLSLSLLLFLIASKTSNNFDFEKSNEFLVQLLLSVDRHFLWVSFTGLQFNQLGFQTQLAIRMTRSGIS